MASRLLDIDMAAFKARERWLVKAPIPDGRLCPALSSATGFGIDPDERQRRLGECRARRAHKQSIDIWEPLPTKAPGPHLTRPYCCYINTVIFYVGPAYVIRKNGHPYLSGGRWRWCKGDSFYEWGRAKDLFRWEDLVFYDGLFWEIGGGTVRWKNRRWWMHRSAVKNTRRARRANGLEA